MDRWIEGQQLKHNKAGVEMGQTLLKLYGDVPLSTQPTVVDSSPARPLQPVTFEIPTVTEALYRQTREAVAKEGFSFVVAIKPVSIGQLVADEITGQRFVYVNNSENMRSIVPQEMEVAIDPKNLMLRNSNSQSTDRQIEMLQEREAELKGKLPEEVRDLISMPMQGASVLAQLDASYWEETGKLVFTDWFGRTDDETFPGHVAYVGRDPLHLLNVNDCSRGDGNGFIFAVPAVVLPRKLAEPAE